MKIKQTLAARKIRIDRENGVIHDVSIISQGEAQGHGFSVDQTMLQQVAESINSKPNGVPCRMSHPGRSGEDPVWTTVGRVGVGGVKVADGRVIGDLKLAKYAASNPRGDLRKYILDIAEESPSDIGVSIVFDPADFEFDRDAGRRYGRVEDVTAADLTGIPAANKRGLLSAQKGRNMDALLKRYLVTIGLDKNASDEEAQTFLDDLEGDRAEMAAVLAGDQPDDADDDIVQAAQRVMRNERKRYRGLCGLAEKSHLDEDFVRKHYLAGRSIDDDVVREEALDGLAKEYAPLELDSRSGSRVRVGKDRNRESLSEAISDAICLRSGRRLLETDRAGRPIRDGEGLKYRKPHERAEQLRGRSLLDLGRVYLRSIGHPDVDFMGRAQLAKTLLDPRKYAQLAQSTDDFPNIMANAVNKSLLVAYEEAPAVWPLFCKERTVADFKNIKTVGMGKFANLMERTEGGEITFVTISEQEAETYALSEYAGGFAVTRRAIINDDMSVLDRIPEEAANAGRRKEDILAVGILTSNPTLDVDSTALFHEADHGNLAGSGAAPSVSSLNDGRHAMRTQTATADTGDGNPVYLNIEPYAILGPAALEGTIRELVQSDAKPDTSNETKNIWQGALEIGIHPMFDNSSESEWFLSADPRRAAALEMAFLESERRPQVESEVQFSTGDMRIKVTHCAAAAAVAYRGVYKNPGA